jgi:hypothetical protein
VSSTLQTPTTWVAGTDRTTAAKLNKVTDAVLQLQGATPGTGGALDFFNGRLTTATGFSSGTTLSAVSLNVEDWDYSTGHAATVANYVVQTNGYVEFHCHAVWAANATGQRAVGILKNGTDTLKITPPSSGASVTSNLSLSGILDVVAGDTLALGVWQNSGGSLNLNSVRFSVKWCHS